MSIQFTDLYSGHRKTCPLSLQPGHHNKIEGESSGYMNDCHIVPIVQIQCHRLDEFHLVSSFDTQHGSSSSVNSLSDSVSTGIGPPFLRSPDVLDTAAGPFSDILATFSFLTATCDLLCFLLTGFFFFGADLVSDFCLSTLWLESFVTRFRSNFNTRKRIYHGLVICNHVIVEDNLR